MGAAPGALTLLEERWFVGAGTTEAAGVGGLLQPEHSDHHLSRSEILHQPSHSHTPRLPLDSSFRSPTSSLRWGSPQHSQPIQGARLFQSGDTAVRPGDPYR